MGSRMVGTDKIIGMVDLLRFKWQQAKARTDPSDPSYGAHQHTFARSKAPMADELIGIVGQSTCAGIMRVNDEATASYTQSSTVVQALLVMFARPSCHSSAPTPSFSGGTDIGEVFRDIGKTAARPDLQKQVETLYKNGIHQQPSRCSCPESQQLCTFFVLLVSRVRTGRVRETLRRRETHPSSTR